MMYGRKLSRPAAALVLQLAALAALILITIAVTGCSSTIQSRAFAARQAYVTTLDIATDLREAGLLDDDDFREFESVRVIIADELDALDAFVAAENTDAADEVLFFVQRLLRGLRLFLEDRP